MSRLSEEFGRRYERIDALFFAAVRPGRAINLGAFDTFRRALAQALAIEEQVLMPALAEHLGARFTAPWRELKARHENLLTLLVPTPCDDWAGDLRELLDHHRRQVFRPGGLYPLADVHLASRAERVLSQAAEVKRVKVAPFQGGVQVRAHLNELLHEVGVI